MSTDIATTPTPGADLERLQEWVYAASKVHQMAQALAKTSFVPKSMQGRPDEITGAIMAGRELGLDPMAALRSIDIIDGTPAIRAVTLRALVQAQGHQIWVEQTTPTIAQVHGRRRGDDKVQTSLWTMERARQAGLDQKTSWKRHPSAMLVARATAEVARLIAADALIGMPYTAEEIRDGMTDPIVAQAEQAPAETRTFRREPNDLADSAFQIGTADVPELAARAHDEDEVAS